MSTNNQQPDKQQLTNNEYLELIYAECEDCQFYGNRCHCRYEQEEPAMTTTDQLDELQRLLWMSNRRVTELETEVNDLKAHNETLISASLADSQHYQDLTTLIRTIMSLINNSRNLFMYHDDITNTWH